MILFLLSSSIFRGKGEQVTELSWPSCRQLLYQSVATVLAHAGFESAQESVLETLTDLVHEHYLRLTRLLRVTVDREARLGASPFPDVVEQVFHEVGIGSVLALQRFWQVRIKDYHSYMLQVRLERKKKLKINTMRQHQFIILQRLILICFIFLAV